MLSNNRCADELSMEAEKQRSLNGKRKQSPNKTQGEDGIVVCKKLRWHNKEQEKQDSKDKKKALEREIKYKTATLTK